jgi:uncharacterized membrane protein
MSIFRSAITNKDGEVNVGYLSLFALVALVVGVIPLMCLGTFLSFHKSATGVFDVQGLGAGVGMVCGGFATALGALGVYMKLDTTNPVNTEPK